MRNSTCPAFIPIILLLLMLIPAHGCADPSYIISSSATAGGTITPSGDVSVQAGSTPIFYMTDKEGYKLDTVLVDQKSIGPVPAYTFPPVHANHTIFATFRLLTGSITVISEPRGASVSIDGIYYGTTWMGGGAKFTDIPVGPHTVTVSYEGYQDLISDVVVRDGEDTLVRATLIPATSPTTTATTSPTTTATTVPTTTATTSPTTTATTVPTTTATTSPTTTATTIPTTTATTSPTTTATTIPTTTATTFPTTKITTFPTTLPITAPTTIIVIPPFVGKYTAKPSPTPTETWNITPGLIDFRGGSGAAAGVILSLVLCGILVSSDLLTGRALNYSPRWRTRLLGVAAYALSGAGLFMSLTYLANTTGLGLIGRDPGLWIVMSLLTLYLCISSFALIIGSLRAWPLRWTVKVHTASGAFLAFIGMLVFLSLGSLQGAPLAMGISASLLAAVASRWHDIQITRQIEAGVKPDVGAGADMAKDSDRTRVNTSRPPDSFPAEISDRYYDIEFIGSGGISRVFLARKRENGEVVALKIPIHFDETAGKCFMKEIMAWEGLDHPNIVQVSEVNILPVPYVEMEYVDRTLNALPRPLPSRKAAEIILGIARGLAYAHKKGIIHRDIKPQNILITPDGTPKITDWGMSKVMGAVIVPTLTGFSLSYAAPEQVAPQTFGDTDQRTDIYQLGTLFFELVTGRVPFEGDEIGRVSSRIVSEEPESPSAINPEAVEVEPIIKKCIEKDPAMRYQSAEELIAELEKYLKASAESDKYQIFED
jgi:hypothetical protein